MNLLKQSVYVLIMLLVVVLVWVGYSAYLQSVDIEINPNASSYTRTIRSTFDTEEIENINTRITENFSVSPEEFFLLDED
jgi:Tfp pilus assembly protein PilO